MLFSMGWEVRLTVQDLRESGRGPSTLNRTIQRETRKTSLRIAGTPDEVWSLQLPMRYSYSYSWCGNKEGNNNNLMYFKLKSWDEFFMEA
jgi:hypothetical protein